MRKVLHEARRTARLIDDLLLLARADSDSSAFSLQPIDLAPVVDEVAEQPGALAAPGAISVTSPRSRRASGQRG